MISAREAFDTAWKHYQAGQLPQAEQLCRRIIQADASPRRQRSSATRSPARCTPRSSGASWCSPPAPSRSSFRACLPASRTRCCSRVRCTSSTPRPRTASPRSSWRAIAFAFYRRLVLHPRRLEGDKLEHTDALIILGMIGGLMVTLLLTNACQFLARSRRQWGRRSSSHGPSRA